jgi:3-hydroxyacyl-CoA dehydrogenase/3a,7a,12a-trihydroxy-5b-cholest-24-enoyl-CoA hydratase
MKRFAQAVFTTETRDEAGELVCGTEWTMLFRFDGGFDGPRPPAVERHRVPTREPDFVVEERIAPEQALLYRLSGDWNPLHADPELAKKVGFDAPILHGLCTYGYVGRAVLREACGGDPARMKSLSGQFRRAVFPGETLLTRGWREGEMVYLQSATGEKPEDVVFGNAHARVTPA